MEAAADTTDHVDPRVWRIAAVVVLGPLMTQMDATVVNLSLSSIGQALHATIDTVQWVVGGYLLALALMLPLNAWLVERIGAKRLYLLCFSAFTSASLLCGAARSIDMLIAARALQGLAGGLLAPMAQMMIAAVAGRHMSRVVGYTVIPVLIAPILGPTLAGFLLKHAGWPWLFYINLPVGALAVLLAAWLLPGDTPGSHARRFDLPGFLLISPALVALLFGLDRVRHTAGMASLTAAILLLSAFVLHALRRKEAALVDVRLFANRIFRVATLTQFLSNGAVYAGQMLLPLLLIQGCGFSPSAAGWSLAAQGLGMLCVYPAMGALIGRFGCRAVSSAGAGLMVLSMLPLLWLAQGGLSGPVLTASLFLRGLGQGAVGVPSVSAAYAAVPRESLPLAATASNIAQRVGGPTATTLLGLLLSTAQVGGPKSFYVPLLALTGLQTLVLLSALRLPLRIPVR